MADPFETAIQADDAGDLEAAVDGYRRSLQARPVVARHNLGKVLSQLGREEEAEAVLREALAVEPDFAPAQFALAMSLLAQGRYREAWPWWEGRRRLPGLKMDPYAVWPDLGCGEWRGEPVAGRRLLVFYEQGFGDQLMFGRFVDRLRDQGARASYVCLNPLASLLPDGRPAGAYGAPALLPLADHWCFVGSLPGLMDVGLDDLPPPARLTVARRQGSGVGVMTRGRPTHVNDSRRSMPSEVAEALLALGRDLSPEATGARDFRETAQIVAGLDLVITVDTAMAHLAGSLGVETWVLLPDVGVDWRWLRGRADSPWYPSVRLFRRAPGEGWRLALQAVQAALAERAAAATSPLPPGRGSS